MREFDFFDKAVEEMAELTHAIQKFRKTPNKSRFKKMNLEFNDVKAALKPVATLIKGKHANTK